MYLYVLVRKEAIVEMQNNNVIHREQLTPGLGLTSDDAMASWQHQQMLML